MLTAVCFVDSVRDYLYEGAILNIRLLEPSIGEYWLTNGVALSCFTLRGWYL